jgi:alpha-galactosidase
MLETGVRLNQGGLTLTESRSHFGAWCIVSSPLILSHDLNDQATGDAIWPIISNTEALAVNQAWAGFSGSVFKQANATVEMGTNLKGEKLEAVPLWQMFYKPVQANGASTAVLVMNHDTNANSFTINFSDIPGVTCTTCNVRDLWAHQNLGSFTGSWSVQNLASHDSVFLMITPQ